MKRCVIIIYECKHCHNVCWISPFYVIGKCNFLLFQGDAIVCSVAQDLHLNRGKSSKTLLDKGGQGLMAEIETKYPNGSQPGELATISGGSLGCQELYLGYLPDWKSSKGKVS